MSSRRFGDTAAEMVVLDSKSRCGRANFLYDNGVRSLEVLGVVLLRTRLKTLYFIYRLEP